MLTAAKPAVEFVPVIQLQRMNKWYGQFHVLKDIDLQVTPGERIVVAGPSGSGKSTMI
ncbi:ABC transporter ATP-binding protein, partial [Ochrobactrum sp. MYb14]